MNSRPKTDAFDGGAALRHSSSESKSGGGASRRGLAAFALSEARMFVLNVNSGGRQWFVRPYLSHVWVAQICVNSFSSDGDIHGLI